MLHPRTLKLAEDNEQEMAMQAREINKPPDGTNADPEAQTTGINHPIQMGIVFLLLLWLIQSYPTSF